MNIMGKLMETITAHVHPFKIEADDNVCLMAEIITIPDDVKSDLLY